MLEALKLGIEQKGLDPHVYGPRVSVPGEQGQAGRELTRQDILNPNNGPISQEVIDVCMVKSKDCGLSLSYFYFFKALFEGDTSFQNEMLQLHDVFEPSLPLF